MQVSVEQLDPCKIGLTVEIETEKVAKAVNEVYREYSKVTKIPGFRPGKAPRSIVERYVSEESVRQRAAEVLVPKAYSEAIKENDIHPYSDPDVEMVQFEQDKPLIFKAEIPLAPKVELGEYKGIEVERPKNEVSDADVEAQIKRLQAGRATSEKVEDRGIETGDLVVVDIASALEGEEMGASRRSLIDVGTNPPSFDESILGMKQGERKVFDVEYPADFSDEELAGKKMQFDASIDSIRARIVPDLDDEFAKNIGGFETMDELRADVRTRMTAAVEEQADAEVEAKIVNEIISRSQVFFPEVMIEHDLEHEIEDIQERLKRQGLTPDLYLKQLGKTQEEFLDDLRQRASVRLRSGLVLGEIIDKEGIDVTGAEVEAEIDRLAAESNVTREAAETYLDTRGGRKSLGNSMLNRRVMEFVKSVSVIR